MSGKTGEIQGEEKKFNKNNNEKLLGKRNEKKNIIITKTKRLERQNLIKK